MEFDSPEAAKEFPGLYLADAGKASDSLEYVDDGDKKKKKEKKDSKKDKGYSALAAESSQDEDDPKSPGKGMKIKAFSKLSGKKKDKDKKSEKSEKDQKKAEKEAKEKRKSEEKERKSIEKELSSTPGPSAPRPQIPFSGAHLMKSNSHNQSAVLTPQSSLDSGTPVKRSSLISSMSTDVAAKDYTPTKPKEKSGSFNVFLNAPAPLLSKLKDKDNVKDKESKKEKEHKDKDKKHKDKGESKSKKDREHKDKDKKEHSHASGMAKVKLKLMRSKNSLDDTGDLPHITSHQFPEDPESLAKEIKKYEGLLEQAHTHLKSSKKISKKQEEQLWELQRTLTQLKRKLRSINALSSATSYYIQTHSHPAAPVPDRTDFPMSPQPPRPIFKKCDSIDGHGARKMITSETKSAPAPVADRNTSTKENDAPIPPNNIQEIPKIPMPPSKNSHSKVENHVVTSPPVAISSPQSVGSDGVVAPLSVESAKPREGEIVPLTAAEEVAIVPEPRVSITSFDLASPRPSIDTIVQVHRSSVSVEKSDSEDVPEFEPKSISEDRDAQEEESPNRRASISNDSQDSKENENIEDVLDDANKMIGSMHEELMFENAIDVAGGETRLKSSDRMKTSSNPVGDDSDVEFFANDPEFDPETNLPNEESCPDPFSMPVFDTAEYLSIENEALAMFHEQLNEDLRKEKSDLEELLQKLPIKTQNPENESSAAIPSQEDDDDISDLMSVWSQVKSENDVLWDNVNRLRLAVAACRVDEFRLQTRFKYIETKVSALSPVTTTTPLQTEG